MLHEAFKERMRDLLGEMSEEFFKALDEGREVKGIRVNTAKCDPEAFFDVWEGELRAISYCKEGFIPTEQRGLGNTAAHHAGMIYVQDPGAMAALTALDIEEGWHVLDMCSAPGGKSSQAAALIGEEGFILSNEIVPKRAKTVVSNFERLGIANAIVTSLDTSELPKLFEGEFDLVICDAPCSGEGMFRKDCPAIEEWSEAAVIACAERQSEILKNAPRLIKGGGYLLYSTCTYSLEENEMTVDAFLSENPDFELVAVRDSLRDATADGIVFEGAKCQSLNLCRRFYPHKSDGEGQFVALMKKRENDDNFKTILYKSTEIQPTKQESEIVKAFFKENLYEPPAARLVKYRDNLMLTPHGMPIPPKGVFMAGVLLGEIQKGILRPSHQFFSVFGALMKRIENLENGDARLDKYLLGEEIECRDFEGGGWCCVAYHGVPLGGGKASGGVIKNHYPKGLRKN